MRGLLPLTDDAIPADVAVLPVQDLECVTVKVTDANSGGMLATIESLPGFIPYSLMEKPKDGAWLSHEVKTQDCKTI